MRFLHENMRQDKKTSIVTQLITGHAPLNKHLHRIGKAGLPLCPSCHEHEETIPHFILHCPAHQAIRRLMMDQVPNEERSHCSIIMPVGIGMKLAGAFEFVSEPFWRGE